MKILILTFVFVVGIFLSPGFRVADAQSNEPLFTITEQPSARSAGMRSSIASVRESAIALNLKTSRQIDVERLSFSLFDGKTYVAQRTVFEMRKANDFTWRGKIVSENIEGDVILTFKNGYLYGSIFAPEAVYEIVAKGDKQMLVELDQSLFPECGGEIKGDDSPSVKQSASPSAGVDSGDRIDVLVVYTTATKNFLGGDAQAQAHAQAAVDMANTSYLNSKMRLRLRMVHVQEYLYTETTSASTDLSNLRANAAIQALRDTHKADLVDMIGEISGACGVGYLMGNVAGNQNNGYTVTARSCAVGNITFAHELGHNMGSHHNPENGGTPTYPYGFGHYVNGVYRTVMSYVDPCPAGCTRRPYFSNPNVEFSGFPTGLEGARDNARSINNTADTISNYRYSGSSITLTNFNGGEMLPRLISRPVTWSSDVVTSNVRIEISRDESTNWETLVATTPNDGSENVTAGGRVTRRARLRVVSVDNPLVSDSSVQNISIR